MKRQAALVACGGALAYTVSKVTLALRQELGIHGFPAPPESYVPWQSADIAAAQFGNAGVGLVAALLALLLARSAGYGRLRVVVLAVSWIGVVAIGAGVAGFALRAFGVAPSLGPPAADWTTYAALAVGFGWVGAWAMATIEAHRTWSRARVGRR
ncbi:hypothetical protein [Streptosporangium sp. KLBMP 9127]|nr:hypothetical protein [Streptosporangium sp. KLBMP 9127]